MKKETLEEEIECSNCGNLMSLLHDNSVYACFNHECTSCYEEEPKQETIEEANWKVIGTKDNTFYNGAKWQQERMYSEEDMYKFANFCRTYYEDCLLKNTIDVKNTLELLEQFKKEDKQ